MNNDNHNIQSELTSPQQQVEDIQSDVSLRPDSFDSFVGQKKFIDNLKVYIKAAKKRNESLDHVLLFGPQTRKNNISKYYI